MMTTLGRDLSRLALVIAMTAPLLHFSFGASGAFRVELGGIDDVYRYGNWGRDYEDHGPYRERRGIRRMTYFQARAAHDGAGLHLPAVVSGGNAELALRVHRYGQPGIVRLFSGGVELGRIVFERDSYPWDVRRIAVPRRFLEGGFLDLDLVREETAGEVVDLPPGTICAFDWVELSPDGPAARLRLTARQWSYALALPILVFIGVRFAELGSALAALSALGTAAILAWAQARAPGAACYAASRIWLAFPLGLALSLAVPNAPRSTARRLGAGFAFVVLLSSTILFWPDHFPPDVRPHLRQVGRIAAADWSAESFWELSSSYGREGRTVSLGRRRADADYAAPYSPWSYFVVHELRLVLDEPRFLVEYLSIVFGALLVPLVYGLGRVLSEDGQAAGLGALLAALEISIGHHASRTHMPALLGEAFFAAAVLYLTAREQEIAHDGRAFLRFAVLSLLATLSYPATLMHFAVFIGWLVVLEAFRSGSPLPGRAARRWLSAAVAGTLGSFLLFYRHFLFGSKSTALLHPEPYRAPATFFLLRNQPRDTVRILELGHPAFLALAIPAYFRLREWVPAGFSRRVVWAWTAAYVTFLVGKDPAFFPGLLLQIKEDLFVAPLACALGGMVLARLVAAGRGRRLAAYLLLVFLFALRSNDYIENADTIHPPAAEE